jgi:hypothetical protein
MKPLKIGSASTEIQKIKTSIPSNSPTSIKRSSEVYVDYTNFQDNFILVFDEIRNRLHFISPDEFLTGTYNQEFPPEIFSNEIANEISKELNIDFGEY